MSARAHIAGPVEQLFDLNIAWLNAMFGIRQSQHQVLILADPAARDSRPKWLAELARMLVEDHVLVGNPPGFGKL